MLAHISTKKTRLARFIKMLPKIAPIVRGSFRWSFHPGYGDEVTTLKLEVEFMPSRSDCKDIIKHFGEDMDAEKLLTLSEK